MSIFELFDNSYGAGTFESMADGVGGTNILHDGTGVDHINPGDTFHSHGTSLTVHNAQGGVDVISDGHVVSHTQPNVMGGVDVYDGDMSLEHTTIPNVDGGVDIYNPDMSLEGSTVPNVFGGEDYHTAFDNSEEIMSYDDPLLHSRELKLHPFAEVK